jgi:DNA-binding LytR/AlgR family response regulator
MTTALLADDEPQLTRALAGLLAQAWPDLNVVHVARNGVEAAERIAALQPDIAFLDIQMPGLTGLEVAQGIEGHTRVVFVTAYDEYAVTAFEHNALDYLLKPVQAERLARTVARLREGSSANAEDTRLLAALQRLNALPASSVNKAPPLRWVRASHGDVTHQVPVQEVLFFHADDKYTVVQTAEREYLIRTSIAELAQSLDGDVFVQVHRSTIINQMHLASTRRDEASRLFLRIKGHGAELPVSRAYVHLFRSM